MINSVKKIINNKLIFCILFLFVMYLISFKLPIITDDYAYSMSRLTGENLKTIKDIIISVSHEYMTWNGRLLGYFTTQVMLLDDNQIIFRLLYPIINLIIVTMINHLIFNNRNETLYFVSALYLFPHVLVLNQTMFWIIGWSIYVFPLIFIIAIIEYFKNLTNKKKIYNKYLLLLCSFCGSLYVEHYSLVILGISLFCIIIEIYRNKKISNTSLFLFVGSLLGIALIFFAPGLHNRASGDLTVNFELLDKLHFGWSRFIYTYFYMNQRIFLLLSLSMVLYNYKRINNRILSTTMNVLLLPIILLSILILFKPNTINTIMLECLTGEWSYYTCEFKHLLMYSTVVIYYVFVLFANVIVISSNEKCIFNFVMYSASVLSCLIFVLSNMACERTQYISYVLLMIIFFEIINKMYALDMTFRNVLIVLSIMLFAYNSAKYIKNYNEEYKIYKYNDQILRKCAYDKCDYVELLEHNYVYIFKSDLNFEDQNGWVMNVMRRYYNLDEDTIITSLGE